MGYVCCTSQHLPAPTFDGPFSHLLLPSTPALPPLSLCVSWGLKAAEPIARGRLVIEYIGEVINEAMMRERNENQRKLHPNDHDFYIMQVAD